MAEDLGSAAHTSDVVHGIFMPTAKHGFSVSTYERTTQPTWEYNLRVAEFAEQAGFDYLLAGMRWSTQGGIHEFQGERFEGIVYMSALAARTSRVTLIPTIHSRIYHPVMAAKMIADIDRVSGSRVGINIVSGLIDRDNLMFGQVPYPDDERLTFNREWMHILKSAWAEKDFDFEGEYFRVVGSYLEPKPRRRPIIVKAGGELSKQLIVEEGDWIFIALPHSVEQLRNEAQEWKERAAALGRTIRVCSYAFVLPRDTLQSALDLRARILAHGYERDYREVDKQLYAKMGMDVPPHLLRTRPAPASEEERRAQEENGIVALGSREFLGEPERIASEINEYLEAGLDGVLYTFWDYERDLHRFADDVLPLLRSEQALRRGGPDRTAHTDARPRAGSH